MKRILSLLIIATILLSGCSNNKEQSIKEKIIPVNVVQIKEESHINSIDYVGILEAKETKKYSFKTGGKISNIYVEEGKKIKNGTKIAELDKQDLNFQLKASKAQMEAAKAQYDKAVNGASEEAINKARLNVENAQKAYDYTLKVYNDLTKLFEQGAISKKQLDDAKLKLDSSEIQFKQSEEILSETENGSREEDKKIALSQYEAAKIQYEANKNLLDDAVLVSDIDGYIVSVLNRSGEIVGAGYPIAIVSTDNAVVNVGLTQKDVKKLKISSQAIITADDTEFNGEVINIDKIPDSKSRTYNVEISLKEDLDDREFNIGSIVKVSINIGEHSGIWIPIQVIRNDGEDYVYIVQDGRAVRKNIQIKTIYEDKVLVQGLNVKDQLVVEGMKNLKAGYKVNINNKSEV
ncbi:efflux RND transporter periplasmic adaptor subunit [Abyssisolibacter fermentans]|uniref:efflux RND transporter periplasmic adaptor subunit n=1 Tax=Abyssisolibacter fermentans TaxID=1766203 RepID=UPI00082D4126|nr:efflux RND transporter periplasmic adaptor subunit [Abyssisolibacter fermentans]